MKVDKMIERCPVCLGNGLVPNGFYSTTNQEGGRLYWISASTEPEMCRSCSGKGWIKVPDSSPLANNCPACGGDRNSPALTGCPRGSHYGTYG